jgi:hypothetical protein
MRGKGEERRGEDRKYQSCGEKKNSKVRKKK